MDRKIRFRVWNGKTKEWVHGPGEEVNLFGESILLGAFMYGIGLEELNDCQALQYTGLKDKNDKEIYEGDIIQFLLTWFGKTEQMILIVKYDKGSFEAFMPENKEEPAFPMIIELALFKCEIIGNIFDNPELLEHKKL